MSRPLTNIAHERVEANIVPGSSAIDATAGNGHDTLFLARALGTQGRVLAIDIQAAAIAQTHLRLEQHGLLERTTLVQGDHQHLRHFVQQKGLDSICTVMFNLGYHPGGKRDITTTPASTILAIKAALNLLRTTGGMLSVMAYRGHPGGAEEAEQVKDILCSQQTTHHPSSPHLTTIATPSPTGPVLYTLNI